MASFGDLVPIANASAFIFTGSITLTGASTVPVHPVDVAIVVVSVEKVIKAPQGLRSLAGQEVTVQLLHALAAGRYVFFADPVAIGAGIVVKEQAHLEATAGAEAEAAAAVERGFAVKIEPHVRAAFLVALGTVGEVRPLLSPAERRGRVPWAMAPFEVERVLKGEGKPRHMTLLGPLHASKYLPDAPALRAGLHAILILQRPPQDAIKHLPEDERQAAAFIATPSDIQPPDHLEAILQIISGAE